MAFSRRLLGGYAAPAIGLFATLALLAWLLPLPGFVADKIIVAVAACGFVALLWARTRRTNRLIARFLSALKHRDLAQSFRTANRGSGFGELGDALDEALQRLRDERLASQSENRFAAALVDEAPTPLLAIDGKGVVTLVNKAARRLFHASDGRHVHQFSVYGEGFAEALAGMAIGTRVVCRVLWNGLPQRAVLAASLVDRQGRPWRVVAVHIIQGELDAAEIATQSDLVRVLTHEIMNSLTPVTSLAASAEKLIARADAGDAGAIGDARLAIEALSRRAAGIAHFVDSYRAFSGTPTVTLRRFEVRPWIGELVRSFGAMPQGAGVAVQLAIEPDGLRMKADPELMGQVILNLLKNGGEAAQAATASPSISIRIRRDEADRVRITVADTGAGVPDSARRDIFLPFFTSKPHGTGVGLSFARQVVLLHHGTIGLAPSRPDTGAEFEVIL